MPGDFPSEPASSEDEDDDTAVSIPERHVSPSPVAKPSCDSFRSDSGSRPPIHGSVELTKDSLTLDDNTHVGQPVSPSIGHQYPNTSRRRGSLGWQDFENEVRAMGDKLKAYREENTRELGATFKGSNDWDAKESEKDHLEREAFFRKVTKADDEEDEVGKKWLSVYNGEMTLEQAFGKWKEV